MANYSQSNKRIAKNTVVLYLRMLMVMGVTLFSSRIVLQALGVDDFGLYNVVGGVVGLFAFLRSSMEKSTQRFLNVEMSKPDGKINDVFCVSMTIHIIIMVIALLLSETIGLWFLNHRINIPDGRELAANLIYQSTIFSFCCTILSVPYSACIIAYERMNFYAVVGVLNAVMKLVIAYIVLIANEDKLIIYGYLMAFISITDLGLYFIFCKTKFNKFNFKFLFNKDLLKEMVGFTGWNIIGQMSVVGVNQGNSILVNMFHNVAANAAMSVGVQVNNAVISLSANFQTAFNPQITKSYASNDINYMRSLVYGTSKMSFLLLIIVSMPLFFNIDTILVIWLKTVPPGSSIFCILTICSGIVNALSTPLNFCIMATGQIKWSQIISSFVYFLDLIVLYVLFVLGMPPATAMAVKCIVVIIVLFVRLYYTNKEIPDFCIRDYWRNVLCPLTIYSIVIIIIGLFFSHIFVCFDSKVLSSLVFVFVSILLAYYIALNKSEQSLIINQVNKIKGKLLCSK